MNKKQSSGGDKGFHYRSFVKQPPCRAELAARRRGGPLSGPRRRAAENRASRDAEAAGRKQKGETDRFAFCGILPHCHSGIQAF